MTRVRICARVGGLLAYRFLLISGALIALFGGLYGLGVIPADQYLAAVTYGLCLLASGVAVVGLVVLAAAILDGRDRRSPKVRPCPPHPFAEKVSANGGTWRCVRCGDQVEVLL